MTLNHYVDGNAVDGEALDGMRWMLIQVWIVIDNYLQYIGTYGCPAALRY